MRLRRASQQFRHTTRCVLRLHRTDRKISYLLTWFLSDAWCDGEQTEAHLYKQTSLFLASVYCVQVISRRDTESITSSSNDEESYHIYSQDANVTAKVLLLIVRPSLYPLHRLCLCVYIRPMSTYNLRTKLQQSQMALVYCHITCNSRPVLRYEVQRSKLQGHAKLRQEMCHNLRSPA